MLRTAFIGSVFFAVTVLCQPFTAANYTDTCKKMEKTISSASQVFYPGESECHTIARLNASTIFIIDPRSIGSPEFDADISHWANSSSQVSACSVEPGTPQDVGLIASTLSIYSCSLI